MKKLDYNKIMCVIGILFIIIFCIVLIIDYNSYDILNGGGSVGIGYATQTKNNAIAIGNWVKAQANYAIQIGYNAENYDSNTFKVANQNGNFEIMSADGTIPAERIGNLDFGTME